MRILSASRNLIYVIIIPILSFFILKDGRAIRDSFLDLFGSGREDAKDTLDSVHTLLLQYMRALLFLCCATFISLSIVLSAMDVPLRHAAGRHRVPARVHPSGGAAQRRRHHHRGQRRNRLMRTCGGSIVYLGIYRMFQDYVLSPHLMSQGVQLHPLLIIFGVFAGGEIGGVAGVFLSVPVLALIRLLYHHRFRRRNSARTVALNM